MTDLGVECEIRELHVLRKEEVRKVGVFRSVGRIAARAVQMARQLRGSEVQAVWINTLVVPAAVLAARLSRKGLIVHLREAEWELSKLARIVLMLPLSLASVVVCNSQNSRRFLLDTLPWMSRRAVVVYNGKDWSAYDASSLRTESPIVRLLSVGRINPRKGHEVAISAAAKLKRQNIPVHLRIAGDAFPGYEGHLERLRQLAKDEGMEESCEFLGFVEDISREFSQADVVLVPSLVESFGTVVAEALASGTPTVASRIPGIDEIIHDGVTGLLFSPGDSQDLAAKILMLIQGVADGTGMALAAKNEVFVRFSAEKYREELCKVARQVSEITR
jgi:glycosyltransferase involved in cell wall biosynthesis